VAVVLVQLVLLAVTEVMDHQELLLSVTLAYNVVLVVPQILQVDTHHIHLHLLVHTQLKTAKEKTWDIMQK
jgi:hypothetical protein